MTRNRILLVSLLLAAVLLSGCKFDTGKLFKATSQDDQPLIKAEIVFTDGKTLVTYLKDLGVEDTGKVYVGGSSSTNMYDAKGNITGVLNYQHVIYIKILPSKAGAAGTTE
ncbi:MAG: hypothetical protein ACM3PE_02950 [Deltaproteobacteria bacterium]